MMKEKKVWIVIGCILVLGSTVTGYTHSYIKKQPDFYETEAVLMAGGASRMAGPEGRSAGSQAPSEEAAPAPASLEADAGVPAAASFGAPAAGEAQMPEMAGRAASPEADSGPASPEAVSISPAAGPGSSQPGTADVQDYKKRLQELDTQIQKMREEGSANVYSFKVSAETELSMWENEMNTVYGALEELMDEEDKQELKAEQQEWMKTRDENAAKAAKNSASVDTVGYAAELVNLTRDRAYELAEEYEEESEEKAQEAGQGGE